MAIKRNKFEIAAQSLILAAGVILSVILISIMVVQFEQSADLAGVVSDRVLETTQKIKNADLLQYDGAQVTGADVRNLLKQQFARARPEVDEIEVCNGTKTVRYTEGKSLDRIKDSAAEEYIDPAEVYVGRVTVNANGIITGMSFMIKNR